MALEMFYGEKVAMVYVELRNSATSMRLEGVRFFLMPAIETEPEPKL